MAYASPDKAAFIAAFPSFSAVSDDAYALWSGRAGRIIDPLQSCLADDTDLAAMLVTAHLLTLAGLGTGAESEIAAQGMGSFRSIKSGSLQLDRGEDKDTSMGEYGATSYGRQAWPMLKACLAGPRITGTGYPLANGCYN